MTRTTNFGRKKRTYLEAGFSAFAPPAEEIEPAVQAGSGDDDTVVTPPSKRKKRRIDSQDGSPVASTKKRNSKRRDDQHEEKVLCTVCWKNGHTPIECRKAPLNAKSQPGGKAVLSGVESEETVCYRCGSRKHRLAACKKRNDPKDPTPFATCTTCAATGHVVATCPHNQPGKTKTKEKKVIEPSECMLCGQPSHSAKECGLRDRLEETRNGDVFLGPDPSVTAADEDDFHILKRRHDKVAEAEDVEQRLQRLNDTAAQSKQTAPGAVKQPITLKKAKVVNF